MKPKDTVVIDFDGTLSNPEHRLPLIKKKNPQYDDFFSAAGQDTMNPWCRELMTALKSQFRIVIVSGRPDWIRDISVDWLKRHDIPYDELHLLRAKGDNTPDQNLKRAWLRQYGADRILFSVDDRQKVVDMWRAEGVVCLQCAAWSEFKR